MSVRDMFLYDLSSKVLCEFCEIMDTLSDLDWTRFGESQPARDAALTGGETGGGGRGRRRGRGRGHVSVMGQD